MSACYSAVRYFIRVYKLLDLHTCTLLLIYTSTSHSNDLNLSKVFAGFSAVYFPMVVFVHILVLRTSSNQTFPLYNYTQLTEAWNTANCQHLATVPSWRGVRILKIRTKYMIKKFKPTKYGKTNSCYSGFQACWVQIWPQYRLVLSFMLFVPIFVLTYHCFFASFP